MKTIFLIEDDEAIVGGLREALSHEHFKVLSSATGEKGLHMVKREKVDLIILDLILPDMNGEDICRELRKDGVQTPILILSSKNKELDKVLLLEMGADDFVTKPFSLRELIARVKALLRRNVAVKEIQECSFGAVYIDFRKQEGTKGGKPIRLKSREAEILRYLVQREGEVVTRDMLLNDIWGYDTFPVTRTVDNFILSLRKKIEQDPSKPKHVLTVHTAGYKFVK